MTNWYSGHIESSRITNHYTNSNFLNNNWLQRLTQNTTVDTNSDCLNLLLIKQYQATKFNTSQTKSSSQNHNYSNKI